MREVIGKRVGVRWDPPALVYVYQLGQVLRLARIPLRNLEDEDLVEQVYKKHENVLLQGLERRYVHRMVDILRHHHGIESQKDKQTEGTTSDRVSERGASFTGSQARSMSKSDAHDVLTNKHKKSDKEESVNVILPKANKLVDIQESKKNTPINRLTRGSDILLLLNQVSENVEESQPAVVDNLTVGHKRNLEQLPKLNRRKNTDGSNQETNKEILDLITKDLSRVQRDKRTLVNMVKTNEIINSDLVETSPSKDGNREEVKTSRKQEPKISVDESEDTDVDLEDLDIPLDPEEPTRDPLDDDDFWS